MASLLGARTLLGAPGLTTRRASSSNLTTRLIPPRLAPPPPRNSSPGGCWMQLSAAATCSSPGEVQKHSLELTWLGGVHPLVLRRVSQKVMGKGNDQVVRIGSVVLHR